MKTRKHIHFCEFGDMSGGKGHSNGKKVSPLHNNHGKDKALKNIFDRYYKEQVAALYKAIQNTD